MSDLPPGWAEATLSQLGSWKGGGTPSKAVPAYWEAGDIPWVSPKDMKSARLSDSVDKITEAALAGSATNLIDAGSVLVVTRSGILAHTLPVATNVVPVTINQDLKALTPSAAVSADYIVKALSAFGGKVLSECSKQGTTVDSIDSDRLQAFRVPVPPLAEQRRIVATIDALTARSKRARAELTRVRELARRGKNEVLAAEHAGLGLGRIVEHTTLGQGLHSTFYGPRFPKEAYVAHGVPTLRTTDFRTSGEIAVADAPRVTVTPEELAKWGLVEGDLLITRTGSIGKCALYRESYGPALPSAFLIRARPDLRKLLPEFALAMLSSPAGQRQLTEQATAVTQPNVNAGAIRAVALPACSLPEQRAIVARIEAAFVRIDAVVTEAERAAALLDRLDQAVLAKAFRGELVPQDPADEPASALLARLAADRPAAAKRRNRKAAG